MVGPGGVEPPTSRLSGVRSNHLSYEPRFHKQTVFVSRPLSAGVFSGKGDVDGVRANARLDWHACVQVKRSRQFVPELLQG
jgi:hypothetical protein